MRDNSTARQFDFWLGDWNLTWGDDQHGVNRIRSILDGKVVQENFESDGADRLVGLSVSAYNPVDQKWRQTWVDNQGSYLDFVGDWQGDKMILQRNAVVEGQPVIQRMVWYNIEADRLEWNWERSSDDGQTWKVIWKIDYTRMK
jgi:hypothetical protein